MFHTRAIIHEREGYLKLEREFRNIQKIIDSMMDNPAISPANNTKFWHKYKLIVNLAEQY
jgi:hypothetical protein